MREWQPIETAPLDGTMVLLYTGERAKYAVAYWDDEDEDWVTDYKGKGNIQYVVGATHWMPLPDPPQAEEVTE